MNVTDGQEKIEKRNIIDIRLDPGERLVKSQIRAEIVVAYNAEKRG